jgi:hypothetical protein
MPGEPPIRTIEPGTSPPPRMLSSSPMPVCSRGTRSARTSASGTGRRAAAGRAASPPPRASSASVFHSPQPGQRPCHFAASAPQAEQTNTDVARAMVQGP